MIKIFHIFALFSINLMLAKENIAPTTLFLHKVGTEHTISVNRGNLICGIYKITNPKGKIYIGQTKDIIRRISYYKRYSCRQQTKLYHSLKKYGWEAHKFEVIHECKPKELNDLEVYYIELYQCFNTEYGLNLSTGGSHSSHVCTLEARENMRLAQLGKKQSSETIAKRIKKTRGLKRSNEFRERISTLRKGTHPSPQTIQKLKEVHKGIKHSEATKKKLSLIALKRNPIKHSKETKLRMSIAKRGLIPHNKGKKFNSITKHYFDAGNNRFKNHVSQQVIKF